MLDLELPAGITLAEVSFSNDPAAAGGCTDLRMSLLANNADRKPNHYSREG